MQRFTLYTYKNRDEFESFYKKKKMMVYYKSLFFKKQWIYLKKICSIIDVSNLVEYLIIHTADLMPAIIILSCRMRKHSLHKGIFIRKEGYLYSVI